VGLVCLVALLTAPRGQARPAAKDRPAILVVRLPEEDAELKIGGAETAQKGKVRRFSSPPLAAGKQYTYTVVATWEPNNYTKITRKKVVTVEAGKTVEVDLRKPGRKEDESIVVRFVPTPEEVVDGMCKLAGVGKDDVVYDLGCGDGRFLIAAVSKFNAKRGVGVDINPDLVKQSKKNAEKAGVDKKVEIRQGDVLKIADLADATVVMLYMGEDINLRLRPILRRTLKPGARIVSHQFKMGDWEPTKSEVLNVGGVEYEIHLWRIEKKK
jgi:uncharacterized protein (TIGR03000 family)